MIEHRLELIFRHVESNTLRMPEDLGVGVAKDPKELKKLKPMWMSSFLPRFGHSDPIHRYSNVSQYFSTYPLYTPPYHNQIVITTATLLLPVLL